MHEFAEAFDSSLTSKVANSSHFFLRRHILTQSPWQSLASGPSPTLALGSMPWNRFQSWELYRVSSGAMENYTVNISFATPDEGVGEGIVSREGPFE